MNKADVVTYLESNQDPRGIAHWDRHAEASGGLRSYGIGVTKLRKYAKKLGRDARLAGQLWQTDIYEAKILAMLIDDPKQMTIEQAETQVEQLQGGYLAHVFSSCDATLAKTPFVLELMERWIGSQDPVRRRCGYGLLYEVSKWKKKNAPEDSMFLCHLERIEKTHTDQPTTVLYAMGTAIMGIGLRNRKLNASAFEVARLIGPINVYSDGRSDPTDFAMRLKSEFVQKRLKD